MSRPPVISNDVSDNEAEKSLNETRLQHLILHNNEVFTLMDSIEKLGCKIPTDFFRLRKCTGDISGGFVLDVENSSSNSQRTVPTPKIIVCDNKHLDAETFRNTVIHELVHAYDSCRVKNLETGNCKSIACTEIRASALSGECALLHEAYRGHFNLARGHRECVKRRATLSVGMNPLCEKHAADDVGKVFEKCYDDFAPFPNQK